MKKSLILICSTLLLVSLSCQALIQQVTPQPQAPVQEATVPPPPEPTQAAVPAPTEPAASPMPADATQPPAPEGLVALEDLGLMFWSARVSYNPGIWQPGEGNAPLSLAHRQLSTCILYEQGPTEPPPPDREVKLGPVTYQVAEMEAEGKAIHWYMAVNGPQGPFADGTPTLVISDTAETFERCRESAEEVLVSLR